MLRGCIPKKLLIYGAHYADYISDARNFGWTIDAHHNWETLIKNKNIELDRLHEIYKGVLKNNNVITFKGVGNIIDEHTVSIGGNNITAENLLIAVGGWPSTPDIPGIENVISSNEALELKELPKTIAIVGGGYIGVEFASIFASFGVHVTLVLRGDYILRGFDSDVRKKLQNEMAKRNISIINNTVVKGIKKFNGKFKLETENTEDLVSDLVMYATGRTPNVSGLVSASLDMDKEKSGAIKVDEKFRTSIPNICAIGDVTDRIQLTPIAIQEGTSVSERLFNSNDIRVDYKNVPTAVFSSPPLAFVGLNEEQARDACGDKVDIFESEFKPLIHTISGRDERTYMKIIVDRISDKILGVHMVGIDAPEIIQGIAIAVKMGAKKRDFDSTTGIHPSSAEEFVTMKNKR